MLHWTLGNVTAEIKILMERFTCFISSEMFENGKTYHSLKWKNISQLIFCRLFTDLFGNDITVNFLNIHSSKISQREKYN
jgi:lipopolysaccharide biosynthesis glycosyltransferase